MNNKKIARIALASVVLALAVDVEAGISTTPASTASTTEKCYGVAAASKNDCGTVMTACAASISAAGACYAWISTPKGLCQKINGGSVGKPAAGCINPLTGEPIVAGTK